MFSRDITPGALRGAAKSRQQLRQLARNENSCASPLSFSGATATLFSWLARNVVLAHFYELYVPAIHSVVRATGAVRMRENEVVWCVSFEL